MLKNVASQKVAVYAHDSLTDSAKTGDAANITAQISKDAAAAAASNDANPTEIDAVDLPGVYVFDLTQAESNCDLFSLAAVSSTSGVIIAPVILYTQANLPQVGDGAISVDHDTGGADNLTYKTAGGVGVDNATVEAYLKADWDAGNRSAAYLKGTTTTDVNGQWELPMKLDAETYTFSFFKQGVCGPDQAEQAVA